MIVRDHPGILQLFFITRGSVVPKIAGQIFGVAVFSLLVQLVDAFVVAVPSVSMAAMGIFGIALSLFLGFRNNAAFDRWWEARKLWGSIIATSRDLTRELEAISSDQKVRQEMMSLVVIFAHLHRGHLRGESVSTPIAEWVGDETIWQNDGENVSCDTVLRTLSAKLTVLRKLDGAEFTYLKALQSLSTLSLAQAGCERIFSTPLPFVYSLLVQRTTYLYCWLLPFALIDVAGVFAPILSAVVAYVFFGLQAVTNELEAPFSKDENGLPLEAMCRTIEIAVCEALGKPVPRPVEVESFVLS